MSFIPPIIKEWAELVRGYNDTIFLLSFAVAGLTSYVMLLAYSSMRSERWVKYFGVTFAALSVNFLTLFLFRHFGTDGSFPSVVSQVALSIVSNVFGVAAALEILNRKSLFPSKLRDLAAIRNVKKWDYLLPPLCWTLAALTLIAIFIKYRLHLDAGANTHPWLETLVNSPDFIFSALCLFLMGYAIFANLGARHFRFLALIIASIYAILQIAYGLVPMLSYLLVIDEKLIQAPLILIALPLKFCLCAFAYLLVVRFFEILSELGQLQESEFERRQDYLASEGVVEWIGKRLSDKALKHGGKGRASEPPSESNFVNLVIKLPSETEKRVACIVWPNHEKDKRPRIFDWLPVEKKFSSLNIGVHPDRAEPWEWERALPFVHEVLTDDKRSEIVWVRDKNQPRNGDYDGNMRAVVSMAIQVNGAAIGCLQVARSDSRFSQMAIRQIRQIANMLSSAVQSYRELAGLDLMSIIFAKKQLEELPYPPEKAAEEITTILHDIFAPTVTRLHIDFGFYTAHTIYKTEKDVGHVKKKIEEEIASKAEKGEDVSDTITSRNFPRAYKLLKKQLTARVMQTYADKQRHKMDRFVMGNLLFAIDAERDRYDHAALGTNYLHRKAASTLAADAYLDFSRDYYSDILKTLGTELSAKRLSVEAWFEPIQKILTEQAGFTWVVVRQRGRKKCFGDEEGLLILQRIKSLKHQVKKTRRFSLTESPEIKTQYHLNSTQYKSNHILKLRLRMSEGFIWLGVRRPNFGPELDFPSPWKTFLINFAQIADASLSRITLPERFKAHVEAAQLQGIIASVATTGTMIHQFSNMIAGQLGSIKTLRTAIALGDLKTEDKEYEEILRAMSDSATSTLQIFQSFSTLAKNTDEDHRPCRLVDAARHACKLFEVSLIPRGVKPLILIDENIFVGVSFNVAALALATLVGNSKDAVKDGGMIQIDAMQQGDTVLCRVKDDGRGITPETQNRIFEPKTRTKEYGTGMGLYLTSHSLSENRSSIELTKSDENGSIFTIYFPSASKETTT